MERLRMQFESIDYPQNILSKYGSGKSPKIDYQIIQHYSTEEVAVSLSKQRRFNVLVIDGDHTYEGLSLISKITSLFWLLAVTLFLTITTRPNGLVFKNS